MRFMTPAQALRTAKHLADIYAEASARLNAKVAAAISRGVKPRRGLLVKADELYRLHEEAQGIVEAVQIAGGKAAVQLVQDAYEGGLRDIAGTTNRRSVEAVARSLLAALDRTGPQMFRWADDVYRQVITEVAPLAVAGAVTVDEAAAEAMERFAARGVTGVRTADGATLRIESYAEMATRTAVMRAHLTGTIDRITARGRDLVVVTISGSSCPSCQPYEGEVFSLSGASDAYPALSTATGLFHPNCTHTVDAWLPGLSEPPLQRTAAEEAQVAATYRDVQRLRALERAVRESRRRVAALQQMQAPDRLAYNQRLLRARLDRMDAHIRSAGLDWMRVEALRRTRLGV